MIRLAYSNRTEELLERFAADLSGWRGARDAIFKPAQLIVPNRNVEVWLKRQLAARDGIAGNFEVHFLRRFVAGLLEARDPGIQVVGSELLTDLLLSILLDDEVLGRPGLEPVRGYLYGGGNSDGAVDLRRVQLAVELARLFEEYGFSRPEMLAAWPERLTHTEARFIEDIFANKSQNPANCMLTMKIKRKQRSPIKKDGKNVGWAPNGALEKPCPNCEKTICRAMYCGLKIEICKTNEGGKEEKKQQDCKGKT